MIGSASHVALGCSRIIAGTRTDTEAKETGTPGKVDESREHLLTLIEELGLDDVPWGAIAMRAHELRSDAEHE